MMVFISNEELIVRVSSVLNKDVKQFGKQYLTDGKDDTCWNSDQGNNQWIHCQFKRDICLTEVHIQFQGGFSANKVLVQFLNSDQNLISEQYFYAEDKNHLQVFNDFKSEFVNSVKFVFTECTDFFGRIIIYKLELIAKD